MRATPTEITYDEVDHVGVITLNRPEARNALTFTTYAELEAQRGKAMNMVTLAPRKVLMVEGCAQTQALYEGLGIECLTTPARELSKAAGAVGCLTGVLHREMATAHQA